MSFSDLAGPGLGTAQSSCFCHSAAVPVICSIHCIAIVGLGLIAEIRSDLVPLIGALPILGRYSYWWQLQSLFSVLFLLFFFSPEIRASGK